MVKSDDKEDEKSEKKKKKQKTERWKGIHWVNLLSQILSQKKKKYWIISLSTDTGRQKIPLEIRCPNLLNHNKFEPNGRSCKNCYIPTKRSLIQRLLHNPDAMLSS